MPHPGCVDLDAKTLQEVEKRVFRDDRWDVAQRSLGRLDRLQAKRILQDGAKMYGFWALPDDSLEALVSQLLGEEMPSRGLHQWARAAACPVEGVVPLDQSEATERSEATWGRTMEPMKTFPTSRFSADLVAEGCTSCETGVNVARFLPEPLPFSRTRTANMKPLSGMPDWKGHLVSPNYFRFINALVHLLVLAISMGYAVDLVTQKYPSAIHLFSWPIFFARLGGMATALWTALLFLSMCRSLLTLCSRWCPRRGGSFWFTFLDCHKDLHIEAGKALVFYSGVHIVGHCIGTVPGVLQKDVGELNELLGCAQEDPPYLLHWDLSMFHWPACPLTEEDKPMNFTEALFLTMPGLTGFLLVAVLCLLVFTSLPKFRSERFEAFSKIHCVGIVSWPLLLFFHGSQGWVGLGIPLVILVCGLPILFYASTRLARLARYYLNRTRILRAVIRPGHEDPAEGALVQLELSRPRCLWQWKRNTGMYAFICMPEYAPLQWHPLTITSGNEDTTVNFLIAGIGDWTQELARRCLKGQLPRLALDGPFTAPTQSALGKRVLVAVGAGVGVTPFISLLSTLVAELKDESKTHRLVEAHFYWMSRDPMEFVFAWQILSRWLREEVLQSKIFVHLYTTAKDPQQKLPAFLFKEAVKRQCVVDRRFFKQHLVHWLEQREVQTPGPQFPWAWAEGGGEDLIWVTCPSFESEGMSFKTVSGDFLKPCSEMHSEVLMFPIFFGRPNFQRDIASIGKARPDMNVHVYVCGNDDLVRGLQSICENCAQEAYARGKGATLQKYILHYERFG